MGKWQKRIDLQEFVDMGYLSELNREFLHPLGLALEYYRQNDGTVRLGEVWDNRDDPEGMIFYEVDQTKTASVAAEREKFRAVREEKFGWMIQPADYVFERETQGLLMKEEDGT